MRIYVYDMFNDSHEFVDPSEAIELEPQHHGLLDNWLYSEGMIWGSISHDTKRRFPDGAWIHTSKVMAIKDDNGKVLSHPIEGSLVTTRNSIYKLGKPKAEPKLLG